LLQASNLHIIIIIIIKFGSSNRREQQKKNRIIDSRSWIDEISLTFFLQVSVLVLITWNCETKCKKNTTYQLKKTRSNNWSIYNCNKLNWYQISSLSVTYHMIKVMRWDVLCIKISKINKPTTNQQTNYLLTNSNKHF
jgi:hypothetical protein